MIYVIIVADDTKVISREYKNNDGDDLQPQTGRAVEDILHASLS